MAPNENTSDGPEFDIICFGISPMALLMEAQHVVNNAPDELKDFCSRFHPPLSYCDLVTLVYDRLRAV